MILQTEKEKIAHLLRRFGLGASEAEMTYYSEGGLGGAIDKLLNWEKVEPVPYLELKELNDNVGNPRFAQIHWYGKILLTNRPLEEKLTIFWHDHFATSAQKVSSGTAIHQHINTLRENAGGNFMNLLTEVSKDPGMLYWLDNQENIKGQPNENFAREIMELFTLGIGHYSEKDIAEAARAFTGWTFGVRRGRRFIPLRNQLPRQNAQFYFDEQNHDNGSKTILGNSGNFNGDDVIGVLCGNPQTAKYIATKMWEFFAYENPEKGLIEKLAKIFRESGMEIKKLVRAIMESSEFYSDKSARRLIKNPVDFCFATARQIGIGALVSEGIANKDNEEFVGQPVLRRLAPVTIIRRATVAMGMELMYPPDVAGWNWGDSWITTATMVERVGWADDLMPRGGPLMRASFPLFQNDRTATQLVDHLLSIFDVQFSDTKKKILVSAVEKEMNGQILNVRNFGRASNACCKLIFGSPEFQLA